MRAILLLSASLLHGCCCCNCGLPSMPGGGGTDDTDLGMFEEWAGEKATETIFEGVTGGEMDLDLSGKKVTVTTPDGEMTMWGDGSVPEDYPFAIPPDATVNAVTRLVPKEDRAVTWSAMGESTAPQPDIVAFLRSEATSRGYTVSAMTDTSSKVLEEMEEEGTRLPEDVDLPSAEEGEILQFLKGDDVYVGQAIVGEADDGTTAWMIILAPAAETQAEAPPEVVPVE